MKRSFEPMGAFFNKRAQTYDVVHPSQISGGIAMKDIVAQYLPENTRELLDLGCGTGLELPAIFARFPDARVIGIDLAEDMLAILRERCAGFAVQTLCMSYLDYEYPPARFDAVVSVMSLHHFSPAQKLELFTKIRGSLRPGGVFLNCDYLIGNPLAARFNFLRLHLRGHPPGETHFDLPLTARQECRLLRRAGFAGADVVWREGATKVVRAVT